MKHHLHLLLLGALSSACSVDLDNVFSLEGQGGASDGGASSGGNGSGNGSSDGGSTSSQPPTTNNGGSTSSSPTTTTTTSSSSPVTTTSEVTSTTGMPPQTTVDCPGGPCAVDEGGVCCFNLDEYTSSCVDDESQCVDSFEDTIVAIACQLPSDCEVGVCCAIRDYPSGQAPYGSTECVSECDYPNLAICDINAPACQPVNGPVGTQQTYCKQSTLLPEDYFVCGLNP